jgi:hypothetical protein
MKVVAPTGTTFVARALRYILQSASLLKYLSMPVIMGPTPRPTLSAHQLRTNFRVHADLCVESLDDTRDLRFGDGLFYVYSGLPYAVFGCARLDMAIPEQVNHERLSC